MKTPRIFVPNDATAIACVMLVASFVLLFVINRLQRWAEPRGAKT